MSISITGAINGAAVGSPFSSPTFTFTPSSTTFPNGKASVVTAKGGTTHSTVDVHSASRPFSSLVSRPANIRGLPAVNANGVLPNVPVNSYSINTRKGVTPLSGQASVLASMKTTWNIPAGSDIADAYNLYALLSAHIGVLNALAADLLATALTGEI